MKKLKLLTAIALGATMFSLVPMLFAAKAADMRNTENEEEYIVDEVIEDDLYVGAEKKVVIKKTVKGDLVVGAEDVEVEGEIMGDVYAAGGSIKFDKEIAGTLIVAGGDITMNGDIGRNLIVAGGTITVNGDVEEDIIVAGGETDLNGLVNDDIRAFCGQIKINKEVRGDVIAFGGQVKIEGDVRGDIHTGGGTVTVNSKTVSGDLITYEVEGSELDLNISDSTEIKGEQRVEKMSVGEAAAISKDVKPELAGIGTFFGFTIRFIWNIVMAIGLILLGWLTFKFAPIKSEATTKRLTDLAEAAKSFGIGCLALPVGIIIVIILAISIIGWPTLGILLALASIANMLTTVFAGAAIGVVIFNVLDWKTGSYFWPMTLGIIIIKVLASIPCLGSIVGFLIFFAAIGAMLRMQYFKYREAREAEATTRRGKK